jgi:hypothetical protein
MVQPVFGNFKRLDTGRLATVQQADDESRFLKRKAEPMFCPVSEWGQRRRGISASPLDEDVHLFLE